MRKLLFVWIVLLGSRVAVAQPTYTMANQTVSDCRAFFEDTGNNPIAPGNYGNNENFVFRIINPQATQIIFTFSSFCLELGSDTLFFYDGPNINSPLLGAFTGTNMPPAIIATSGALTIRFVSDLSITCTGWEAYWTTIVPPPIPPDMSVITASCNTNIINIQLDTLVHCDSVYAAAFVLAGGQGQQVVGAQALNCIGDSTTTIRLTVDAPFTSCGVYSLSWNFNILDVCDSLYTFLLNGSFSITDCPITAILAANDDSLCVDECFLLTASGEGGDCNYTYVWLAGTPGLVGPGPHLICLDTSTTFTVIVDDGSPTPSDTVSITILVTNPPFAGNDTLVCDQSAAFDLAPLASPPGGVFFGPGITAAAAGTFDPGLAGPGVHQVFYSYNGCPDTLVITVAGVTAGFTLASCPGANPIQLTGNTPAGGVWSGPNVTPGGMYTPPPTAGVDTLYYNFANCSLPRLIYIDTIAMTKVDTSCQSGAIQTLQFSPSGGLWSGPGIIDNNAGTFAPYLTTPGDHLLIYTINGCSDTLRMHVRAMEAGNNITVCPLSPPFNLPSGTPAGGWWFGPGITDSIAGTFNPGVNGTGNSSLRLFYRNAECQDSITVFLTRTNITPDTLRRCITGGNLSLAQGNTGRVPNGGVWSGPGVNPAGNGTFQPAVAGIGFHRLYYTAAGCVDSMVVYVSPLPVAPVDTVVCISQGNLIFTGTPSGGSWSGPGIRNSFTGLFNTDSAGIGNHRLYYTTAAGCVDSMQVQVNPLPQPSFNNSDTIFCHIDSLFSLQLTPAGGVLSGPGCVGNRFNPVLAGMGQHQLIYSAGIGLCERFDTLRVQVRDSLRIQVFSSADTLCYGDTVLLWVTKTGGLPTASSDWGALGASDSVYFVPTVSGWHPVVVSDGCSTPQTDSIFVYVHPQIVYTLTQELQNCYDSLGIYRIQYAPGSAYRTQWYTLPNSFGDTLFARQGTYAVRITDTLTGCYLLDTIVMRSFPIISANFTINPNERCYDLATAELTFIDLSVGGSSGNWDFGDGSSEPYIFGQYPTHLYTDTGRYEVALVIFNADGCRSTHRQVVCVQVEPKIYVPSAFTPNGDGLNEFFKVETIGIRNFRVELFNRWGEKVFQAADKTFLWDGRFKGELVEPGVYPYVIIYNDYLSSLPKYQKGVVHVLR